MIPLLAILFSLAFPADAVPVEPPYMAEGEAHQARHDHRGRYGAHPSTTPSVRVTIVNATCVPAISLSLSGTNGAPAYPVFAQGDWTTDAPFTNPVTDYVARDTNGVFLKRQRITYRPVSKQYLLLTGDLSREGDQDHLPGVSPPSEPVLSEKPSQLQGLRTAEAVANLQFHVIPCEGVVKDPSHYRFVNCIPGSSLLLRKPAEGGRPAKELAFLTPGSSVLLTGQPDTVVYEAEVQGTILRLEIFQEGAVADCLIPFFLRDGKPSYATVFESP